MDTDLAFADLGLSFLLSGEERLAGRVKTERGERGDASSGSLTGGHRTLCAGRKPEESQVAVEMNTGTWWKGTSSRTGSIDNVCARKVGTILNGNDDTTVSNVTSYSHAGQPRAPVGSSAPQSPPLSSGMRACRHQRGCTWCSRSSLKKMKHEFVAQTT